MPAVKDEANGLEKIVLCNAAGCRAEVYLHGAHVVSWRNPAGKDILFTSEKAIFCPPKAIRGGVPVCFPQFGQLGPLGQHGFARNSMFAVGEEAPDAVTLVYCSDGTEDSRYPHPFELRVSVKLHGADTLEQRLMVRNTGDSAAPFTAALHTYFAVSDISAVTVEGLDGVTYSDSLADGAKVTQAGAVKFDREVDRIYIATPDDAIKVVDAASGTIVEVRKSGFPDAVVWNPWISKAAAMADFGDDEYKVMLCIEPAVAGSGPVMLAPGETWEGIQTLTSMSK